ncbi:MAG TPA: prolyl oligopeptidase family serine peptidase [Kofleriaceae bacterium]
MRTACLIVLVACGSSSAPHGTSYPAAKRGDTADTVGALTIKDPYRWLEDMESPDTKAWVAAENQLTDAQLATWPSRATLTKRLTELFGQERTFPPEHRGGRYFWRRSDGVHDLPFIMTAASLDEPGSVVLDANTLAEHGKISFAGTSVARDGKLMGYGTAEGGGDWQVWRFREVDSGKDLPEQLANIKYYRPVIVPGGVYYSAFPAPPKGQELTVSDHDCKVFFHKLGTPVSSDKVVYERPDQPSWQFQVSSTSDDQHIVISIGDGEVGDSRKYQLAVLQVANNEVKVIEDHFAAEYVYLGSRAAKLYFLTDEHAPHKRIAAFDLGTNAWQPVIAESELAIGDADLAGESILTSEMRDAHSVVTQYDLAGKKLREVALPTVGSAFISGAEAGERDAFLLFMSFAYAPTPLRVDLDSGKTTPWHAPKLGFDPAAFDTQQVFVTSKDGTKVPMFVTMKKGGARDGSHPTLLTGYGFGGISLTPYFDAAMIAWMERGGAYALVNVRGGGEYGVAWHDAGKLANEQNKLDDFNAAAAWLAANGIATHDRVGSIGTSGGGFLVAAAMVQHPELYGACIPIAGVLDLLRFQLFGEGAGWQADLGHPANPTELAWLYKISPLHNLTKGTHYPATFVVTSDHDVRVAPLHSYKFAAALQAAQGGAAPVLLHVEVNTGHGESGDLSKRVEQEADILAFAAKYLGMDR